MDILLDIYSEKGNCLHELNLWQHKGFSFHRGSLLDHNSRFQFLLFEICLDEEQKKSTDFPDFIYLANALTELTLHEQWNENLLPDRLIF